MLEFYLATLETDKQRDVVRTIYEEYYSLMFHIALSAVNGSVPDAEDCVHQAMLKIIENINLLDLSDRLKTKSLCCVIVKNKATDLHRKKHRQEKQLDEDVADISDDVCFRQIYSDEAIDIIVNTISEMSEAYRNVMMLKYIAELREKDIARVLDISSEVVGIRIYRGRRILQNKLREEGMHE